ncbi:hypothetical protein T484DRAFT_1959718, partial [Baffinella frigidus]
LEILRECSVVVGLHPDQAAGPMVDFALASGKPFACVPCCVYSQQFTRRRLASGKAVSSYADLVRFLREKHPAIQQSALDIEGKNLVLWWPGNTAGSNPRLGASPPDT